MRVSLRLFVPCAMVLAAIGLLPAAPAVAKPPAQTVFNVYHAGDGTANWEYRWACGIQAPFACYTYGGHVVFQIVVSNRPQPVAPITVSYAIDDITAVHDVNYSGPTTGTLTIDSYPPGHNDVQLAIPIIDTGSVSAPDKTLQVRLTGSSVPGANISDTEIGIIHSAGEIPRDCTPSRADGESFSTTCTGRPAGSQWRVSVTCLDEWPMFQTFYGALITGTGTSSATCAGTGLTFYYWDFHLIS
ncbi:MAG TPA: hypothetical protein VFE14_16610 [Micromonosporaceae bacterium]|nr:hypothetical protein [Micromonosporaceae bacterium]